MTNCPIAMNRGGSLNRIIHIQREYGTYGQIMEIKGKYDQIRVSNAKLGQMYVNSGKYRQIRLNMDKIGMLGANKGR